jgi:hypothetical protein
VLSRTGLVAGRRLGQEVQYTFIPAPLNDATAWIAQIGARWDDRLARLRTYLLEDEV